MEANASGEWEEAVLEGGPAHGLRIRVTNRPAVLQVTLPVMIDSPVAGMKVEAHHLYRKDPSVKTAPLHYGFDLASP